MPTYFYTAREAGTGNVTRGKQEAENEYAAVRILQGRNLLVTKRSAGYSAGTWAVGNAWQWN